MKRRLLLAGLAVVASAVAPLDAAKAAEHVVVSAAFTYVSPVTVVVQGDSLRYQNLDVAPHNVVSHATRADGSPMFESAVIETLEAAPVDGVATAPPGEYTYTCVLHPFMTGVLVVAPAV